MTGTGIQKLSFVLLLVLVAGVSTGLLGGL